MRGADRVSPTRAPAADPQPRPGPVVAAVVLWLGFAQAWLEINFTHLGRRSTLTLDHYLK